MSYLVFARKWRPMQFKDVVAQNHVTTTLENAIKQNRLASAYLFSGPRGVGKTTTARIFAKAINCENGPTITPCNTCPSCRDITDSRSLDVFEIDGASNRGIDEVRNLRENLKYAASKGKHKIYIIDEVHMLTTEAFNALLKTLEEPPARVLFIFATTEPHKVPATILSRCQRYDFRRIPLKEIVGQLQAICAEEKVKIDDESLYLIARKAEGSMRDSLSILDQVVSFCGQQVKVAELSELLGLINRELFFECTAYLAEHDSGGVLQLVETIFKQGYDLAEFLNGLVEHLRNVLVVKATNDLNLIEGGETYAAKYQKVTASFSESDLLRLISLASETATQIKRSSNPKTLLEVLLLKMAKLDKSVELGQLLELVGNLKASSFGPMGPKTTEPDSPPAKGDVGSESGEQAPKKSSSEKSQTNPVDDRQKAEPQTDLDIDSRETVSLQRVQELWPQIVDAVKSHKIHLGSFLNEGFPTAIRDDVLEVSFGKDNGFHINTINLNRRLIQQVIFESVGSRLQIECRRSEREDFRELREKFMPEFKPPEPEGAQEDLQIPILKKVIEVFDGEIVRQTNKP